MKVSVETITPKKAKEWLEKNSKNRPMRLKYIDQLADEMIGGRWKENGDSIRFNGEELIDGQHRLAAIIKSGKSVRSVVVRDLPSHVFDTVDVGKARRAADILALRGEQYCHALAATVRLYHQYESGGMLSLKTVTATKIEEVLEANPGIRESVYGYQFKLSKLRIAPPSALLCCHYIFSKINKATANQFMESMITGVSLRSDPFHTLRERFIKMKMDDGTFRPNFYVALCIKAWNAVRDGDESVKLSFNNTGDSKEPFPVAR